MEDNYLRVNEVAKFLGISKCTVWHFSRTGKLNPIKLSDRVTVWSKHGIESFIASCIKDNQ